MPSSKHYVNRRRLDTLPLMLFLTDGLPTVGETRETAIRNAVLANNKHNRRIFSFGVGFDVNAPLLTSIANSTRATASFVFPNENVEAKVSQVFRGFRVRCSLNRNWRCSIQAAQSPLGPCASCCRRN